MSGVPRDGRHCHDLPQPSLRHVAQHAGDDPHDRRRAGHYRIPQDATKPRRTAGPGAAHGHPLRAVLRQKGTPYSELGLDDPGLSDEALLDVIEVHPILINRPIVVSQKGARLCRPSEAVLDLLDAPLPADFVKQDGERVTARSVR